MLFSHPKKWMVLKILATCLFLVILPGYVESGLHKMMLKAMMHHLAEGGGYDGGGSKGITFGLRSKGMTAVIPVPIPIPMFSKGGGGSKGGGKVKYIPVPVPSGGGGGGGWWR